MLVAILQIIFSALPLLFGRRLFWVFVAVAGFLAGLALSTQLLKGQPQLIHLLVGVVIGLVGGFLALTFTKPMAAVGGFLALGGAALLLTFPLGLEGVWRWVFFIGAGLIGYLLVMGLFDWALIINSSISGAAGIAAGVAGLFGALPHAMHLVLVVVLFAIGIVYQSRELRAGHAIFGLSKHAS